MSILDKNEKTQKNNKLKNTKYQNVKWRGPVFTFSLPGGGSSLYRPSVIPLFPTLELVGHGFADVFMTYRMMKSYINKNLTLSNENWHTC